MPRQARLILDNVCYHVISRGNEKKITFQAENDYEKYLQLILRYKDKYKFKLYGWCLMPNHVHLVIESNCLSKTMHGVNLSYAKYFNYKYSKIGHFWQDRYKSLVIQKDKYLINCLTYIEYNPVRAKIVSRPEDYRWNSYKARILGGKNKLLDVVSI